MVRSQNKVADSPHSELVWEYLKGGLSPRQIIDIMAGIDPEFSVSEPTLYEYKRIREREEQEAERYTLGGAVDPIEAIKNDGLLLDVIINKGLELLKANRVKITLPMILKAMDMKKALLGVEYRGQTVWGLLDSQKQFDQLVTVLSRRCPTTIFDQIVEDLREMGWATTDMPHGTIETVNLDNLEDEDAEEEDEDIGWGKSSDDFEDVDFEAD